MKKKWGKRRRKKEGERTCVGKFQTGKLSRSRRENKIRILVIKEGNLKFTYSNLTVQISDI